MFQGVFEALELQHFKFLCMSPLSEVYSEPSQTSKTEFSTESRLLFHKNIRLRSLT